MSARRVSYREAFRPWAHTKSSAFISWVSTLLAFWFCMTDLAPVVPPSKLATQPKGSVTSVQRHHPPCPLPLGPAPSDRFDVDSKQIMNAMKIVGCAALAFASQAGAFVPSQAFATRSSMRPSGSVQVGVVSSQSSVRQCRSWVVPFALSASSWSFIYGPRNCSRDTWHGAGAVHAQWVN